MACLAGGIVAFIAEMKLYDAISPTGQPTSQKYFISASFFALSSFFLFLTVCTFCR